MSFNSEQGEVVRLLMEHRSSLFAYILAIVRDYDAAEDVLQDDWRLGQWVANGLPENSRGAVQSVGWKTRSGLYYAVRSNRVTSGLFRVRDDTYLNFTYKLDQPGWFNLFAVVRRGDEGPTRIGNFAHKEKEWWRIPPGQWRTASVRMARFHKVTRSRDESAPEIRPQPGDLVNSLWFSTPDKDRGLVIDRVWVTQGKPAD